MVTAETIGRRIAVSSMAVSGGLAVAKIAVGLSAHSAAVISDGIESASDVFASGIVLLGLSLASKPADEEHPYGHGRFETLAGLAVGLMLTATGAGICVRAYEGLSHPSTPAVYAIWPLIASAILKSILSTVKYRYGRKIGSESLLADALNDSVDILSAVTALVAVSLAIWNPSSFGSADAFGAMAVGAIVVFLGGRVCYETINQLMDAMPERERLDDIRRVAVTVPGALDIEKCFARKTGLRYHVDLHLEVDPAMTVKDSHFIGHEVRDRVLAELPWVADVLVHVEPHGWLKSKLGTNGKSPDSQASV